jgi:hypothetical protein
MVAFAQRILGFATRALSFYNSAPDYLLVSDPTRLTPELIDALNERGAMRVTVPSR